jgi:Tfp pilus assembly protein FimV
MTDIKWTLAINEFDRDEEPVDRKTPSNPDVHYKIKMFFDEIESDSLTYQSKYIYDSLDTPANRLRFEGIRQAKERLEVARRLRGDFDTRRIS